MAIGVSKDEFMHSTPKVLRAYDEAHKIKIKELDSLAWQFCGNYVMSAVMVSVEKCFAGRKARLKYIDKPVMKELEQENKPMTEENIKLQRELFVAKLMAMKANFDLEHKKK